MARKPSLDPVTLIEAISAVSEGMGVEALQGASLATLRRNLQRLAATLFAQGHLCA